MQAFWEWLGDNAWTAWVGVAVVFGIVETTTLDLVFIMLAAGALSGGLAAVIGAPVLVQALVAIIVSAAMLGVVRPVAKRHMRTPGTMRTGVAALVGSRAVVIDQIGPGGGTIKLAGEVWTARSYDGMSVIAPGSNVDVVEIDGATALVFEADTP